MEDAITTYEAATLLGIRYETYRQYHHRGTLPIEPIGKFGQALMWSREQVETEARKRKAREVCK